MEGEGHLGHGTDKEAIFILLEPTPQIKNKTFLRPSSKGSVIYKE